MSITLLGLAGLLGTMFIVSLTPGPSDFVVVSRSLSLGLRQAGLVILGIVAADMLLITVAVFGLSALAEASAAVFLICKLLAALCLIWIGFGMARARTGQQGKEITDAGRTSFLLGLLITLGDPRALLFYMGLFPAYVNMAALAFADALLVITCATLVIALVKGGYALMAQRAGKWLGSAAARSGMNRITGIVLIATGLFLAVGAVV